MAVNLTPVDYDPFEQPGEQQSTDFQDDLGISQDRDTIIDSCVSIIIAKDGMIERLTAENQRLRIALDRIWQDQGLWEHNTGYRPVNA